MLHLLERIIENRRAAWSAGKFYLEFELKKDDFKYAIIKIQFFIGIG